MSRSQGTQAQPGVRPVQGNVPMEQDPQWSGSQSPRPPRQLNPQSPAFQQLAYPPHPEQGAGDPYAQQQGYYMPQQAAPQPPRPAQQAYAPQFDPYAQPAPQQPPTPAYQQRDYAPVPPQPDPRMDLRGATFEQWATAPPAQDPRGFDHASYAAPQPAQAYAPAYDQGHTLQHQQPNPAAGGNWGHHDPYAGHQPEPSLDAAAYSAQQHQAVATDQGYEDDAGYEAQPAPRSRAVMIAAALAGAIFVGGGLAYAYSALMGAPSDGSMPLVKSASGPSKVKPSDPGGKQFSYSDSKIMGRLGEAGAAGQAETDASGARKVSTVVVGRDGSIQPPPAPEASSSPAPASSGVPGMSVIDVAGAAASAPATQAVVAPAVAAAGDAKKLMADAKAVVEAKSPVKAAAAAIAAQAPVVVNPPAAPQKLAAAATTVAAASPSTTSSIAQAADAAPAAVAKKAPVPKKLAALAPAAATAAAPAAPATAAIPASTGPAPTGAGYVAVLASVPASGNSRMDALKRFADMQQKYGPVLQNKTPDVQEANLGDKGKYHRLVVGPPGSRDGASTICSQLKTAGYNDCWVMAY